MERDAVLTKRMSRISRRMFLLWIATRVMTPKDRNAVAGKAIAGWAIAGCDQKEGE